jgi:diguanylate cyclase (GGDEF)-like protein
VDPSKFDLSHLPEVFALAILIACFRPLVRRAGAHANLWFAGWLFLLLNFVAQTFAPGSGSLQPLFLFLSLAMTSLCILTFAVIAEGNATTRIASPLAWILYLPLVLQSALIAVPVHAKALDRLAVLGFLAPALYLLFGRAGRNRQTWLLGGSYFCLSAIALRSDPGEPALVMSSELTLLLLTAAWLFLRSAHRLHRGVWMAVCGLVLWAITGPAGELLRRSYPGIHLAGTLLELPIYLMAGGIILTLLEDHVVRTERLAMHDPLTDLPNRRLFEDRLLEALEEARRERTTIACIVIDVDNFKTVNDTLGHGAGDQLLRALAVRLAWHISPRDLLARTGGDEFTALLAGVHDEQHLKFIASAMMSAASIPILVDDKPVDVRISIGIALSPDHADDVDSLRRAADEAMYSAKRRGGSLLAFAGED